MPQSITSVREYARQARRVLRRSRKKVLRRLGLLKGDWQSGLSDELKFWEWSLKDDGRNWDPGEWRNAMDPNLDLQEELKELIPAGPGSVIRILDVGSGPLTRVGEP